MLCLHSWRLEHSVVSCLNPLWAPAAVPQSTTPVTQPFYLLTAQRCCAALCCASPACGGAAAGACSSECPRHVLRGAHQTFAEYGGTAGSRCTPFGGQLLTGAAWAGGAGQGPAAAPGAVRVPGRVRGGAGAAVAAAQRRRWPGAGRRRAAAVQVAGAAEAAGAQGRVGVGSEWPAQWDLQACASATGVQAGEACECLQQALPAGCAVHVLGRPCERWRAASRDAILALGVPALAQGARLAPARPGAGWLHPGTAARVSVCTARLRPLAHAEIAQKGGGCERGGILRPAACGALSPRPRRGSAGRL